jgi:hypothetical protein
VLRLRENAEVLDRGLQWVWCGALLDSGNGGCTLITVELAFSLGLTDIAGVPCGGAPRRRTRIQGVTEGHLDVFMVPLRYRIAGTELNITAGVTTHGQIGCDMLVSANDIREFQRAGFTFEV